jgi:hypothetical protein
MQDVSDAPARYYRAHLVRLGMNLRSHLRCQGRQLTRNGIHGIRRRLPAVFEDLLKIDGRHVGYTVKVRWVVKDPGPMVGLGDKMMAFTTALFNTKPVCALSTIPPCAILEVEAQIQLYIASGLKIQR